VSRLSAGIRHEPLVRGVEQMPQSRHVLATRSTRRQSDTGKEPKPGTSGHELRQHARLVSRDRWFAQVQDRLFELVVSGMFELFLVRSIRDQVRRSLAQLADVGTGDRNRTKVRERLERVLANPAELAAFQAERAKSDPSYSGGRRRPGRLAA
jgi:hypothetical protein